MRHRLVPCLLAGLAAVAPAAGSTLFSQLRGSVEDPQRRPIAGARITLTASGSDQTQTTHSDASGSFLFATAPLGAYTLTVAQPGFDTLHLPVTLTATATPDLHLQLTPGTVLTRVNVTATSPLADATSVTPHTQLSRLDLAQAPGATRVDSLAMITDFVPGAYMTHDMLHIRGGHQVSWLLDGVAIPNTNIASNLGAQIDPRDIDYLEAERGSYPADLGDRTYGAFDVVPRTGFERHREAELVLTAGNFLQSDSQLNLGDHTERFAWYASLAANRSDYGLAPPVQAVLHDVASGEGGFTSLLFNKSPHDHLRLIAQLRQDGFQIPFDPDPDSLENQQFNSSGLRDRQDESDALLTTTWLHTVHGATVLQLSPFFHRNRANYAPNPDDTPIATTADRSSLYAGGQGSLTTTLAHNTLSAGVYAFSQHDSDLFGAVSHDGSGTAPFVTQDQLTGRLVETWLSDTWQVSSWLTILAGLRQSAFHAALAETAVDPRVGLALRLPKLNWVLRGFYGRFYQPPPLLTAAGPLVQYAAANDTTFAPLHGERDEEHQFGLQIPFRGWLLDADTFKTRARNFLDHSNIGNSSLYFPVTVDGALIRAWELTLRSPGLWRRGHAHLAYSNQIAEQRGNLTGGLVCAPVSAPACDAGFAYTPVDHDQRNTLSVGFDANLPARFSLATNVSYGSGFTNGEYVPNTQPLNPRYPNPYLPAHTAWDLTLARPLNARISLAISALNLTNQRTLLDNSLTFGGFHFSDPRQLYAELRYHFHL